MPSPPNPPSSTELGSAFNGFNKANAGKNSNRGRVGRRGRGSNYTVTSSSFCTAPNESPQDNGVKSPSRRRPPYTSKNSSAQASKQVSENKTRNNRSPSSPETNDLPPSHTNTNDVQKASNLSSDVKSNIDALVERVRASAMANNRPNTPGSHIDWAGDDDNSLPDLDDWGISPPIPPTGHTMISPIIVDGLTPLPEPATALECQGDSLVKASTSKLNYMPHPSVDHIPTEEAGKGSDQPESSDIVENSSMGHTASEPESLVRDSSPPTSLHPSLPPKPASPVRKPRRHGDGRYPNAKKKYARIRDTRTNDEVKASTPRPQPQPLQSNDLKDKNSNEAEKGLAASIHAPGKPTASKLSEPKSEKPSLLERLSSPKGTAFAKNLPPPTDGQLPSPHRLTSRSSHSGRRQPATNQTRTQTSIANQSNRSLHSRPVLTGDAISKIAKTIGNTASAVKSSPLSTSTE